MDGLHGVGLDYADVGADLVARVVSDRVYFLHHVVRYQVPNLHPQDHVVRVFLRQLEHEPPVPAPDVHDRRHLAVVEALPSIGFWGQVGYRVLVSYKK